MTVSESLCRRSRPPVSESVRDSVAGREPGRATESGSAAAGIMTRIRVLIPATRRRSGPGPLAAGAARQSGSVSANLLRPRPRSAAGGPGPGKQKVPGPRPGPGLRARNYVTAGVTRPYGVNQNRHDATDPTASGGPGRAPSRSDWQDSESE